ncbi:MAG TPA: hypothetical protein DEO62_03555 [Lachnospiraceae bacterium]|nr:hypothetical protein [Lachnospiraceae bacterium]HBZ90079.1 hypothetical protein [Lachnospiraceae bacterium]
MKSDFTKNYTLGILSLFLTHHKGVWAAQSGCTAGIIGDDVVSVANEFSSKGHEVYAIDTPGFADDSNLGYVNIPI